MIVVHRVVHKRAHTPKLLKLNRIYCEMEYETNISCLVNFHAIASRVSELSKILYNILKVFVEFSTKATKAFLSYLIVFALRKLSNFHKRNFVNCLFEESAMGMGKF